MKRKFNKTRRIPLILAGIFCIGTAFSQQTARDIIQMVQDKPDGENRKSVMTMKLVNRRGAVRERTLLSYSMDLGKDSKSVMFFQTPADVKGTGFLSWQYDDPARDDDRWLYLPAMKKVRRISGSSAKKENFMGSDFTFDDMGGRNIDEDDHRLTGEETIEGSVCWVIETVPRETDATYSKKISWIRQDALTPVKVEFYDRMGALLKTLTAYEISLEGEFWTTRRLEMANHQRNHRTIITLKRLRVPRSLGAALFTVPALERGLFQ